MGVTVRGKHGSQHFFVTTPLSGVAPLNISEESLRNP